MYYIIKINLETNLCNKLILLKINKKTNTYRKSTIYTIVQYFGLRIKKYQTANK